jgi:hypothetical protein
MNLAGSKKVLSEIERLNKSYNLHYIPVDFRDTKPGISLSDR